MIAFHKVHGIDICMVHFNAAQSAEFQNDIGGMGESAIVIKRKGALEAFQLGTAQ